MLKRIITALSKFVNKHFQFLKKNKKYDLVIVDDTMPDIYSGFKIQEFDAYSKKFDTVVYCDLTCFNENDPRKNFDSLLNEFRTTHDESGINFSELKLFSNLNTRLAYCLFFNNIIRYYRFFENKNVDFAYTLYPGGGLNFESDYVKERLKRIHNSKNFKFVIVNQGITRDFLINNNLCTASKIHYIHGTPIDFSHIRKIDDKKWYGKNKRTFDVAFVAHKYTQWGKDKGLDIVVDALDKLSEQYSFLKLHIVGTFNEHDIIKKSDKWECQFYGTQPLSFFSSFFKEIDLIVSPNRPDGIGRGFFDGFPLASSVMGGLHEVPMLLSDEKKQNFFLEDQKDFLLIKPDINSVVKGIQYLINHPEILPVMGANGRDKIAEVHSYENQIKRRLEIIKDSIC
jgi:glycosyltransferase involved in cell wall biosynthesis